LANPPSYLYPRLTPSPATLVKWLVADSPDYREARTTEARKLLSDGQTQIEVAKHFGVTTRTIRNWISV